MAARAFSQRRWMFLGLLVIALGGGWWWWLWSHGHEAGGPLVLQGNVEVRQVNLGFKVAGRIKQLNVDEGDFVSEGQVLASLDKVYFEDSLNQVRAQREQSAANLAKMVAALPPGDDALRRQIALRYLMAGMVVHVDEIIITSGALDALTLSLQVLTRAGDEIAHERRGQIGLEAELRRKKSVVRILIERLVAQEFADRPVLIPVGTLVGRIVENLEAGIEFLPRGVMVEDLIDMRSRHGAKHTHFLARQRGGPYAAARRARSAT